MDAIIVIMLGSDVGWQGYGDYSPVAGRGNPRVRILAEALDDCLKK